MPREHQQKAESHLRFLESIADDFPDWLATVAFYAAVELIEELLAARGHHSQSHFERKSALKQHFPNRELNHAYFDLYNASLDARYLPSQQCRAAQREVIAK
jgi:hypothetical protein